MALPGPAYGTWRAVGTQLLFGVEASYTPTTEFIVVFDHKVGFETMDKTEFKYWKRQCDVNDQHKRIIG